MNCSSWTVPWTANEQQMAASWTNSSWTVHEQLINNSWTRVYEQFHDLFMNISWTVRELDILFTFFGEPIIKLLNKSLLVHCWTEMPDQIHEVSHLISVYWWSWDIHIFHWKFASPWTVLQLLFAKNLTHHVLNVSNCNLTFWLFQLTVLHSHHGCIRHGLGRSKSVD